MTPLKKVNDNLIDKIEDTHTIVEFLKRPVLIYDQDFTAGSIIQLNNFVLTDRDVQRPLFNLSLPWDVLKYGGKDCKVQKFEYFRADVKIKITINANNMTSGRFWLTYAPIDSLIDNQFQIKSKHRAGVTAYPGVEMDININNSVELIIPYSHWAEAMSLTQTNASQNSYASLYLFALTPLRSSSSYGITMQLWAWFENISLTGPTPNTLKPMASSLEQSIANQLVEMPLSAMERKNMIEQINKLGGKFEKLAVKLQADSEDGSVLRTVGSAMSNVAEFADHFELGKEISKPLAWLGRFMDNTAQYFGWSKPAYKKPVCSLANIPGQGYAQAEGVDNGTILGLTQENLLAPPKDVFQTNIDEMEIEYICRNPALVNSASWSKSSPMKQELMGLNVAPFADLSKTDPQVATVKYYSVGPADYVASVFSLWRGTMCYRVTVTKTAYHSGRLELTFIPNQNNTLASTADSSNSYRYILDITNEAEVVIKIPFFSDAYMLPIGADFGYTGRFVIRPITTLHCPTTVSDTVDVQVWKWMEDVVFACPTADNLSIWTPSITKEKIAVDMQIQVANTVDRRKEISFFKGSTITTPKVLSTVAGEGITNLRMLTRAMRHSEDKNLQIASKSYPGNYTEMNAFGDTTNDYLAYFKHMYRFARGGVNIKLFCNYDINYATKPNQVFDRGVQIKSQLLFDERGKDNSSYYRTPEHRTFMDFNPVHEISVPFYSKYRCVPTVPVATNEVTTLSVGRPLIPTIRIQAYGCDYSAYNKNLTIECKVFRGSKDDFSFGALVGPPLLYKPSTWTQDSQDASVDLK